MSAAGIALSISRTAKLALDEKDRIIYRQAETITKLRRTWSPVTESLPEPRRSVLVACCQSSTMFVAWMDCDAWYTHGGRTLAKITHWMPLPDPPPLPQSQPV